jgi:hypothetical protein
MPGVECGKPATRASAYRQVPNDLHWWCDSCDPYGTGANSEKLFMARTCSSALFHVNSDCGESRQDKRIIVKGLAEAKGLPKRVASSRPGSSSRGATSQLALNAAPG